jgi:hypothetical protein
MADVAVAFEFRGKVRTISDTRPHALRHPAELFALPGNRERRSPPQRPWLRPHAIGGSLPPLSVSMAVCMLANRKF